MNIVWWVLVLAGLLAGASETFARTCEVALRLDDPVTLGALQLTIDYAGAPGSWQPTATGIACKTDVTNTLAPFVDDAAERIVTASFISLAGMSGPGKLAHCAFVDPASAAVPEDFLVHVVEASNLNSKIVKPPRISVLMPDCGPDVTTTSTTTSTTSTTVTTTSTNTTTTVEVTTTTLPIETTSTTTTTTSTTSTTLAACGNGVVEDDEQCDDGNTADDDGCDSTCSADVLCGDANGNDLVQTSDALLILRAAIGQPVACPHTRCDADGDTKVRAGDSLRVLKRAVGQPVVLACPIDS